MSKQQKIYVKADFEEILDALMDVVNQDCWREETATLKGGMKVNGYFDSIALSSWAYAMRVLAKHNKIKIVSEYGRRVIAVRVKDE